MAWIYTNQAQGTLGKKTEKEATAEKIRLDFLRDHLVVNNKNDDSGGSSNAREKILPGYVAVLQTTSGAQVMEAQAFSDMCKAGCFPADALAIQKYVREKGGVSQGQPPRTVMFQHEYW